MVTLMLSVMGAFAELEPPDSRTPVRRHCCGQGLRRGQKEAVATQEHGGASLDETLKAQACARALEAEWVRTREGQAVMDEIVERDAGLLRRLGDA